MSAPRPAPRRTLRLVPALKAPFPFEPPGVVPFEEGAEDGAGLLECWLDPDGDEVGAEPGSEEGAGAGEEELEEVST